MKNKLTPQQQSDIDLMKFWVQRKADAQLAAEVAERQIAYLSNFVVKDLIEVEDVESD